jgi:hypothetical protein
MVWRSNSKLIYYGFWTQGRIQIKSHECIACFCIGFFCYLITTTFQKIADLVCFMFLNQLYGQVCVIFLLITHIPRDPPSPHPPPPLKNENPGIHKPQIRKTYIGLNWWIRQQLIIHQNWFPNINTVMGTVVISWCTTISWWKWGKIEILSTV